MHKNNLRQDILKELFNISVGKAAGMLSEIIDKRILLSVPDVKIINLKTCEKGIRECLPEKLDGALMVSSISFEEILKGKANLIFPADKMRAFINLCIDPSEIESGNDMNFTHIDFDIVKEIGNIVLNAIVGEVGNYLDINLDYTLPHVEIFDKAAFDLDIQNNGYVHVLILHITFIIDETEIEGAILVDLTMSSLNELTKKIDEIEGRLYE